MIIIDSGSLFEPPCNAVILFYQGTRSGSRVKQTDRLPSHMRNHSPYHTGNFTYRIFAATDSAGLAV